MNKQKTEIISDISERILKAIDFLNITPNKFGEILGYERSQTVYDIINRKSKPSFDFFCKYVNSDISERINIEWLITGKGEMKKSTEDDPGGNVMDKTKTTATMEDRLLSIIESQQRTIELLSKKGGGFVEGAQTVDARKTS